MSMDHTRLFGSDDDRTQAFGAQPPDPGATQAFPGDLNRTQMAGAPGAGSISLEVITGNEYALSTKNTRTRADPRNAPRAMGQRMPSTSACCWIAAARWKASLSNTRSGPCTTLWTFCSPPTCSVVTFEDGVEVMMPARRVVNKELIKQHISRIQPGNTTNIYDGFVAACSQVASVPAGYVNRVLLLTDGEPTAGLTDFPSIVGQVAEQKSRGITLTCLGFGPEYNEELLVGMAKRAGGNYYYIARPDLLQEVFRKEMEALLSVVGRNLRLTLRLSRWCLRRYGQAAH